MHSVESSVWKRPWVTGGGGGGGDNEVQAHINFVISSFIFKNHFHGLINTPFSVHYRTMQHYVVETLYEKILIIGGRSPASTSRSTAIYQDQLAVYQDQLAVY